MTVPPPRTRGEPRRAEAAVTGVVTILCALGVGWTAAWLLDEPPSRRWGSAVGVAVTAGAAAAGAAWGRRRCARREVARGRFSCGLQVVEGEVPHLGRRWATGHAVVQGGTVEFLRQPLTRRRHGRRVSFDVTGRSVPRGSTLGESFRVGTDAQVVVLTTTGARVRMAVLLPSSTASVLTSLDARTAPS